MTPDIVLRNGIKIYNLRTNPERIDELQGNKSGFTISADSEGHLSLLPSNLLLGKPVGLFSLMQGLFEQRAYAACTTTCKDSKCRYYELKCDGGDEPDLIDLVPNYRQDDLPDLNESQMGNNMQQEFYYCIDHDTSQCEGKGGKVIVPSCKCYIPSKETPEDDTPLVAHPFCPLQLSGCPVGQHLVDGDKSTCQCVPDETPGGGEGGDEGGDDDNSSQVLIDTGEYGYTVYVDIDGDKGNSILWEDIFPFYITLSGPVVPLYNTVDGKDLGGTSNEYLQTSIQYEHISAAGRRRVDWLAKSVSFRDGACGSGYIDSSTPYCSGVAKLGECSGGAGSKCTLKTVRPIKFF